GVAHGAGGRNGVGPAARAQAVADLVRIAEIARARVAQRARRLYSVGRAAPAAAGLRQIARPGRRSAGRAVGIRAETVVGALVAAFAAVGVAVRPHTRIAGRAAAGAGRACLGAGTEEPVGAWRAVRIVAVTIVGALVARLRAIPIAIGSVARIARVRTAEAAGAGIRPVAEQAVVAGRAVGLVGEVLIARAAAVALRVFAVAARGRRDVGTRRSGRRERVRGTRGRRPGAHLLRVAFARTRATEGSRRLERTGLAAAGSHGAVGPALITLLGAVHRPIAAVREVEGEVQPAALPTGARVLVHRIVHGRARLAGAEVRMRGLHVGAEGEAAAAGELEEVGDVAVGRAVGRSAARGHHCRRAAGERESSRVGDGIGAVIHRRRHQRHGRRGARIA